MSNVVKFDQPEAISRLMEIAGMIRAGEVVGLTVVLTTKDGVVSTEKVTSRLDKQAALVALTG